MKRIEIDIKLVLEMPNTHPPVDFIRACGNYLSNALPMMNEQDTRRVWNAGRDVTLSSEVQFRTDDATVWVVNRTGQLFDISDL